MLTVLGTQAVVRTLQGNDDMVVTNAAEIAQGIDEMREESTVKETCKVIRTGGIEFHRRRREKVKSLSRSFDMTTGKGESPARGGSEELLSMTRRHGDFWDGIKGGVLSPERVKAARP